MKKNKKWGGSFKYLIPGIIAVILLSGVLLSNKFITKQSLGSIYNIDEANQNIENIKLGDTINYEINGYSDWQVLYVDKENGTVDVVSKTNVEDVTLSTTEEKDAYLEIINNKVANYNDNNYVVSVRSVNKSDLDNFTYYDNFFIDEKVENNIVTAGENIEYKDPERKKVYYWPYINLTVSDSDNYNLGDIYTYEKNDIDEWFIIDKNESSLLLVAKTPVEIPLTKEFLLDPNKIRADYYSSFSGNNIVSYGNAADNTNVKNKIQNIDTISNYLKNLEAKYKIVTGWCGNNTSGKIYANLDGYIYDAYESSFSWSSCQQYYYYGPITAGIRPVVKLKLNSKSNSKDINSELQLGDYVNYTNNSYSSWRVLNINNNGTINIISGGCIKNIQLYGKDDYDNYENIIRLELNSFLSNSVISVRNVEFEDINKLSNINDKVNAKYWVNNKGQYDQKVSSSYAYTKHLSSVGIMYYDNSIGEIVKENVNLNAIDLNNDGSINDVYKSDFGDYSYTAGLRPIITIKSEYVEKISDSSRSKIQNQTEKFNKIVYREQENANKSYGYKNSDDDLNNNSSRGIKKSNDSKCENQVNNNINQISKGTIRYIVISVSILLVFGTIIITMLGFILKRLYNLK